jgi:hypothetical protein
VKALVAAAVALMLFIGGFVGLALVAGTVKAMCGEDAAGRSGGSQSGVSKDAEENIPQRMLDIYQQMGHRYGIDWAVLAGIGFVETRHWRNHATSSAGAKGPMQFMPATWSQYGQDGDGDGDRDIFDPIDAVAGAAHYLKKSGAPQHWEKAIWFYNHSHPYYLAVMRMARKYGFGRADVGADFTGSNTYVNGLADKEDVKPVADDAPSACSDDGGPLAGTLAEKIVQLARRQVSIPARNRERGGYNCNFYSAAVKASWAGRCANGYRSEQWCADFVMWVYKTAGASTAGADAAAKSFINYGSRHRTWHLAHPSPGDAVVFDFGHVGIVAAVHDTTVTYVSGNTRNPETGRDDAVLEKTVPRSWSEILGYAGPVPAHDPQQDT